MGIPAHLHLHQFRNYAELDINFSPGINLIFGANGQGKSNILEAVCYLGLLRSFRTHRIACLRRWEQDSFFISGSFAPLGDDLPFRLSVEYGDRRILRLNERPVARASEFINRFLCVPFVPEDLELVKGSAGGRRRFMDIVMSQLDPAYLAELHGYQTALRERNVLLREPTRYPATALIAYDRILARYGAAILLKREQFVRAFNHCLREVSQRLHCGGVFSVRHTWGIPVLRTGAEEDAGDMEKLTTRLFELLQRGVEQDQREGNTRQGPHRADLLIFLDDRSLSLYGSEGERRLGSLAMRLGSMHVLRHSGQGEERGVTLLVDDVVGELDPYRNEAFMETISGADQIMITSTDPPAKIKRQAQRIFSVDNGKVTAL